MTNTATRKRARKRQSVALRDALLAEGQAAWFDAPRAAWKVGWHAGKLFKLREQKEELNR